MEKSMGVTVENVRNYIPNDIVLSILSKLPVKSIKRFECVSKSWAILFENPYFMHIFCNNFLSNNPSLFSGDTSLLVQETNHDLYLFSGDMSLFSGDMSENKAKLVWPNPFEEEDPYFYIVRSGCINGILCLRHHHDERFVLWNPATDEFKIIPPSPIESARQTLLHVCGFGYDHIRDDYKLIRIGFCWPYDQSEYEAEYVFEIYSLRSNSWRQPDIDANACFGGSTLGGVYMDGMCHWCTTCERVHTHNKEFSGRCFYMSSFDLSNEVFFTTPIPSNMIPDPFSCELVLLNGSIALITWNYTRPTYYIYILGELGIKESWTKLFTIELFPNVYPIGAWKSDIFFTTGDKYNIVWFNLATQQIKELDRIKEDFSSNIVIYKENLLFRLQE